MTIHTFNLAKQLQYEIKELKVIIGEESEPFSRAQSNATCKNDPEIRNAIIKKIILLESEFESL